MVVVSEPTFPGCVIAAKPIAVFKMRDDKGVDDKVLCVPLRDPNWNTLETPEDLPLALRDTALRAIDEARERRRES
jgi:inorganic pyrophosphatase